MPDRFLLAAVADRLVYGDEATFSAEDARALLAELPKRASPWFQVGVTRKQQGGTSQGFAAGVGDVSVKDGKDRTVEWESAGDAYTRAGQWKLLWIGRRGGQFVEIGQVMADAMDDGRGALVCYDRDGTPLRMDIRVNRSWRVPLTPLVVSVPGWRAWKVPG